MKNRNKLISIALLLSTTSCSTLNESLQLGAGTGLLAGAAATYSAHLSIGHNPSLDNVALGAGIGLGIGLLTSYIVHGKVEDYRQSLSPVPEIYFGDLPPSPFILPKSATKKGGQ